MTSGTILAAFGRFCVPFWRPLDFEGPARLVFPDVFGATAKTRKNILFQTDLPLELESTNNKELRQNGSPTDLAFLHV